MSEINPNRVRVVEDHVLEGGACGRWLHKKRAKTQLLYDHE